MIDRSISWRRTGGRTHVVTIDDGPLCSGLNVRFLQNYMPNMVGMAGFAVVENFLNHQQAQAMMYNMQSAVAARPLSSQLDALASNVFSAIFPGDMSRYVRQRLGYETEMDDPAA